MKTMERINWAPLLLGLAVGVAAGLLFAPEAPQRWKRKARAGVARGREAADVLRDAVDVFHEFRNLARPLEDDLVETSISWADREPIG
jgi:hypothetical protein